METEDIHRALLEKYGLRVAPAMGEYIAGHLRSRTGVDELPIIAGDARTGVPVQAVISLDKLSESLNGAAQ